MALSLHAPSQELRARIVPAAKQWPLHELIEALDDHLNSVSRHSGSHDGLMIEYVLLKGVNDRREDADQLIALLRGKPVMLNLIPYNPNVTATLHGFEAPSIESVEPSARLSSRAASACGCARNLGRTSTPRAASSRSRRKI